jgi:hypothetical protein
MNRRHRIERLDFDDRQVFDEEIGAKRAVDTHALEDERQRLLCLEPQARSREQQTKAGEVGVLQQTRPELTVNPDRGTNDLRPLPLRDLCPLPL